jgi:hypothetical protein
MLCLYQALIRDIVIDDDLKNDTDAITLGIISITMAVATLCVTGIGKIVASLCVTGIGKIVASLCGLRNLHTQPVPP